MRRKPIILGLLLFAFLMSLARPALAHDPQAPLPTNYCDIDVYDEERCLTLLEGGGAFISEWGINWAVSMLRNFSIATWVFDRITLAIFEFVTSSDWLLNLKTDFIQGIASFLPDVLRDTAFGTSGLMYLALVLAGLLMTIPATSQGVNRLVKPERVMTWGVLLSVLFVSGTVGYDLVDNVESLRQNIMQTTIGTDADYGVQKLVLMPMHAQENEADLQLGNIYTLPNDFTSTFFPPAEKIEISMKVFESGTMGVIESTIESPESRVIRIASVAMSVFYTLMGIFSGVIVFFSGVTFVLLGVAALFLILFLFAALPLGFFEFGESVLRTIVERYVQVVMYSLGISIFIRLAGSMVSHLPDLGEMSTFYEWIVLMIVLYLSLQAIMKSTFGVFSTSFMTMGHAVGAVWSGRSLEAGAVANKGMSIAGGAVTGALLMGGAPVVGALAGGVGEALNIPLLPMMMRAGIGQGAAPRPEPERGDVFQNNGAAGLQSEPAADRSAIDAADVVSETSGIFSAPPDRLPTAKQAKSAAERVREMSDAAKSEFGASDAANDAAQTARTVTPES